MIFAFSTDDRSLLVFISEEHAISYCEGIDVANNGWQFFNDEGSPLNPVFQAQAAERNFVVSNGKYSLVPSIGENLVNLLFKVSSVEGSEDICTIEQVLVHLSNSRKPIST
jgi:hypothetical protein